ncbi:MAG: anthranilate phosphoribosyltransferase [Candidatus Omnitrophica bacterium]|nr:anthranilate phosphoribosyltransferase [Candidatus Omnitrophota bacterium]
MRQFIDKINQHHNLSRGEMHDVMTEIMSGRAIEHDILDFLAAMNAKGPSIEEITGAAQVMRKYVLPVNSNRKVILDTCGTGGDGKQSFNISTAAAFVVAGAGVGVAKHGNRSVSSLCGSADVLEELGVNIEMPHEQLNACLKQVGLVFLFAQRHHPAMKHVAAARKTLGVKTLFNILGPLTNPAHADHQMMGVYSRQLTEPLLHVLKNLGTKKAIVVHGADGLDEISTTDKTFISEFDGVNIRSYEIVPEEFGLKRASEESLKGGDKVMNARIIREILEGAHGPQRSIVQLNAAFALYAAGAVPSPEEGMVTAAKSLNDGDALDILENLIEFTHHA